MASYLPVSSILQLVKDFLCSLRRSASPFESPDPTPHLNHPEVPQPMVQSGRQLCSLATLAKYAVCSASHPCPAAEEAGPSGPVCPALCCPAQGHVCRHLLSVPVSAAGHLP